MLALRLARAEVQAAASSISEGIAAAVLEHIEELEAFLDDSQEDEAPGALDVRAGNVSAANSPVPWGAVL